MLFNFGIALCVMTLLYVGFVYLEGPVKVKTSNDLFNRCEEICAPYDAILRKSSAEHCACNPCMILKKVEK